MLVNKTKTFIAAVIIWPSTQDTNVNNFAFGVSQITCGRWDKIRWRKSTPATNTNLSTVRCGVTDLNHKSSTSESISRYTGLKLGY